MSHTSKCRSFESKIAAVKQRICSLSTFISHYIIITQFCVWMEISFSALRIVGTLEVLVNSSKTVNLTLIINKILKSLHKSFCHSSCVQLTAAPQAPLMILICMNHRASSLFSDSSIFIAFFRRDQTIDYIN